MVIRRGMYRALVESRLKTPIMSIGRVGAFGTRTICTFDKGILRYFFPVGRVTFCSVTTLQLFFPY